MTELAPSTADYLRFHALHRPDAIALIDNGRKIDYATFHRDLRSYTRALRRLDCPRGTVVAVACERFYEHWLILLACENLGWATASFLKSEGGSLEQLLAHVELVLTVGEFPRAGDVRWHRVTQEWLAKAGPLPGPDDDPGSPMGLEEAQRLRRSSGTTGGFKMMIARRRLEEARIGAYLMHMGFTPHSRLLVTVPFTVGSMYSRATACLRLGATCISAGTDLAHEIVHHRPSHVRLFQFQMKTVLDKLPDDFEKSADLTLMIGAAPVSAMLWRRLRERLARRILYSYNCNEAGGIASVSREGECTVRPGVEVEIVDELGAVVARGQAGEVRVRTPGMVEGYHGDPELTARKFRDGWFYTGDAGTMVAPGRFRLEGRTYDTLNVGGRKIAPGVIENIVELVPGVEDVGVTSIPNADGIEELCIAVVLSETANRAECAARIGKQLPGDFGKAHIKVVREIPRTEETGKVRRSELKKPFAPKGRQ